VKRYFTLVAIIRTGNQTITLYEKKITAQRKTPFDDEKNV